MRLLGAAMLIAACGGAGLGAARELERRCRLLRDMERVTARMRTEVCLRRLPLPEVLRVLSEAYPDRFAGAGRTAACLPDVAFGELWSACIKALALPPEAEEAMRLLGEELALGTEPEAAFDRCREELSRARSAAGEQKRERSKLYVTAGFSLGCLVAVALL